MNVYHVIAGAAILAGLWNLMIALLGRFPKFQATAVGTLTKADTRRNIPARHGRKIPVMTRYAYTYTVNGRQYRHTGEGYHSKRGLLPKAAMVYVKWFPRRAYPNRFKGTREWIVGVTLLYLGLMCAFTMP